MFEIFSSHLLKVSEVVGTISDKQDLKIALFMSSSCPEIQIF